MRQSTTEIHLRRAKRTAAVIAILLTLIAVFYIGKGLIVERLGVSVPARVSAEAPDGTWTVTYAVRQEQKTATVDWMPEGVRPGDTVPLLTWGSSSLVNPQIEGQPIWRSFFILLLIPIPVVMYGLARLVEYYRDSRTDF